MSISAACTAASTTTTVVASSTTATPSTTVTQAPAPSSTCPSAPQIPCQKCLCNSGSELFEPCNCPANPNAMGCQLGSRAPVCDVDSPGDECPCGDSVMEWKCGPQAVMSISAACTAASTTRTVVPSSTTASPSTTVIQSPAPSSICPSAPQIPCQKCLC